MNVVSLKDSAHLLTAAVVSLQREVAGRARDTLPRLDSHVRCALRRLIKGLLWGRAVDSGQVRAVEGLVLVQCGRALGELPPLFALVARHPIDRWWDIWDKDFASVICGLSRLLCHLFVGRGCLCLPHFPQSHLNRDCYVYDIMQGRPSLLNGNK